MLHETQKSHGATPFAPIGLTRSGMACWFSLMWIIKESAAMGVPCYLWTLTFRKTYPDSWCGNMHRNLVALLNNDAKRRPQYFSHGFGAVRVTEVHPGGHGIHFHWIVRGRINLAWMRFRAGQCGFGFVFIARDRNFRFRRVDAGAAGYLAKYLVKNGKLHGVRQWSCIGDFEGTKTKDVVFDSRQNRVFRQAYAEAKALKKPPGICWMHAHKVTRHWEHNADDRD